jgi:hypothetical protein
MLSAPVDLGPVGAQARIEPGRLQASSKIENSVVTTGFQQLVLEPMVRKSQTSNKSRASHMMGAPRCVTKGEIIEV